MNTTLITSLGTGMYGKEGYRQTIYHFASGIQRENNMFLRAVLDSKLYDIGKIIIIGTRTSSWDILAEDLGDTDFWMQLKDECSSQGISDASLNSLQNLLTDFYNFPVLLSAHNPVICKDTIDELFPLYINAIDQAGEDDDILLDITHGFRSMPIFMYQSLLFKFSHTSRHIQIIYGEFIKSDQISYVRDLSSYWELSQITEAKNRFFMQLDGKLIAEKLDSHWPKGAKCIRALSGIVECNFALQIPIILNQIGNVLKDAPESPSWIEDIKTFLEEFKRKVSDKTLAKTLYNYASFLAEKKLFVQAVIALQISVEVKIITLFDKEDSDYIGNYEKWQDTYKKEYHNLRKKFEYKKKLNRLEELRNQIAHGGSISRYQGGSPQAVNTEKIFYSVQKPVLSFFKFADNTIRH
ncbi:TIGR02221 family CRISPR-associated protein [Treponema sp. OMZ 788]|uniref:TIGR02221 family CRISPR-associated protein n=1 Tax=Treponema sp. OMZ 788 TaxID=2563664 RepID=UPI0020A3D387|nr:TIGR02221 family CRISPR-associated protein [Treponema sp. OMZ 788]UTC65318.1 TIGR02221 family CRISPR-associated protein [Treponema sp. OMZ 788]